MNKIGVTTTTFAQFSNEPLILFKSKGYDIIINEKGQKLNEDETAEFIIDCDGVIAGTEIYSQTVFDKVSKLKVISRLGVGLDNINLHYAQQRNIIIFKTKTSPALAVAELTIGLIIDVMRNISQQNSNLKSGIWQKEMGCLLYGKTLGIIGLGTIGKALVQISKGFHFNILAFDNQADNTFAKENDVTYSDLRTLLKSSDIVAIHLNLSDQTKYIIDQNKIKLMKPNAILINTSRGEIIDENALYEALKNNQLAGAGLDVFKNEPYNGQLTEIENVVLTPHIGGYAKELRIKMEIEAAQNLIKGLDNI